MDRAAGDAAGTDAGGRGLSLRTKGLLAFAAVTAYLIAVGTILDVERVRLRTIAVELETVHDKEAALAKTMHAINHSMLRVQGLLARGDLASSTGDDLALDVELIQSGLQVLQRHFPEFSDDVERLGQDGLLLRRGPSLGTLASLHEGERALDNRLTELDANVREERAALWARYHEVYDRMTLVGVTAYLVGMLVVGGLITVFFTRLAWDTRTLAQRAGAIVGGYRGPPLEVTRDDEIGGLMSAVNRMQSELRQREQKLELAREQYCHREKMAAVGSLASAVAHEINNPIAAIAGIAQAISKAEDKRGNGAAVPVPGGARMILEQAQRIATISRQIAQFTRPPASGPELLDLNGLVQSMCGFLAYDKRLGEIEMSIELDHDLPAIKAVADHLSQVLMNLLFNAADALDGVVGRRPTVRVATRAAGERVALTVADNGRGMDAATLGRAFEESFTTKPIDAGRGLGLFVSRTLVERGGGRIEIDSAPDVGTTVTVTLPIRPTVPA